MYAPLKQDVKNYKQWKLGCVSELALTAEGAKTRDHATYSLSFC